MGEIMFRKSKLIRLCIPVVCAGIFAMSFVFTEGDALAFRRPYRGGGRHQGPSHGHVFARLPIGYTILWITGMEYFYHRGIYYQRVPAGYAVVPVPVGTTVVQGPPVVIQAPEFKTATAAVTAAALNVRSGPSASSSVIDRVYQGNVLIIYGNAPNWLYVKLPNGHFGWVMAKFTTQLPPSPSG